MNGQIRTIEVTQPSSGESHGVLRVALAILIMAQLVARSHPSPHAQQAPLLPYQVSLTSLREREIDWILVRELRLALEEICSFRAAEGNWPTPKQLTAEAIPPFGALYLVTGKVAYQWKTQQRAGVLTYLGRPSPSAELPLLLLRFETAPSSHRPLSRTDRRHTRLADGTIVHDSLWLKRDALSPAAAPLRPEMSGWTQVILIEQGPPP